MFIGLLLKKKIKSSLGVKNKKKNLLVEYPGGRVTQ